MSAQQQLALPGLAPPPPPDPLTKARAEAARLSVAWHAVAGILDSAERTRLQPLYFAALILVDKLESGAKWWH
jgi:hypothetical protein